MQGWRGVSALAGLAACGAALAADPPGGAAGDVVVLPPLDVVVQRLDDARSQLQPSLGATRYEFGRAAIEAVPGGDNTPLNQVLLRAPGVAQDSFGQIHVRGDHNEVQYRLDGVQLPEGLAVFGQTLQTRFADRLSLITGSLPAQYGFNTAAVVDIATRSGTTNPGGEISIYGGARDYLQPSLSYGGRVGAVDYFYTGDFVHGRVGIENPTGRFNASHDLTNQAHGLGKVSVLLDDTTRVSLLGGHSNQFLQIPNRPGQSPQLGLTAFGTGAFDSADLRQRQREITDFGILSLQKQIGAVDLQMSAFTRYSSLYYSPDLIGDLLFNGVSQRAARSVLSVGTQTDASWRTGDAHTLRAGFQVIGERTVSKTDSLVLATPQDPTLPGNDAPFNIHDGTGKTGKLYGVYLQDEWRVAPKLTINYGLRYDRVEQYANGDQISPRVNAVYKPWAETTLHAGYSRYFTPPPFELVSGDAVARFANTSAATAVTRNDTVQPERSHYFDLGVDQVVLPGLRVGVDAYYKSARNLIDEGQFGSPVILTAFNYRKAQVHGIEFSGSYDLGPWSLYGNVAWSRAIGKGIVSSQFNFGADELAYIASRWVHLDHDQRWTGSAGAAYTVWEGTAHPARLSADVLVGSGLRADYASAAGDVPNGRALPGHYAVNLSAVQTIRTGYIGQTQLRLDVINLLDSRYKLRDGTGIGVGAPQYGLRRTILAGIAQRF